ncbi:PLDc N-terminal domain-containing protein [uncultured Pontibacter sp.]|uniref:PLDc N-terminal domain-containing protein n=1 Tax=uncultured Pontibacter sp. TaxID=453356 RepID=UPI0026062535|nr:PLDc N-terminal domain-containing protein [uncultured Pontibacter sp.]
MELFARNPEIFLLVTLNYLLVAIALIHLIFKSDYPVGSRLIWVAILWVVPVLGIAAYWLVWYRRQGKL